MDLNERQLITDLFRRMRNLGPLEKDREAEALIAEELASVPDAPYLLAQTVLVQEMALSKADERIRELEAGASLSGVRGGFLGRFGLGSAANSDANVRGSVPSVASAPDAPRRDDDTTPLRPVGPGQPPAGGSFLGTALSTAAGVAGGMLLAESIRGAMGKSLPAAGTPASASQTAEKKEEPHYQDANDNDPGTHKKEEASHDDDDHDDDDDDNDDDHADAGDFDGGIDV